MKYSIGDTIKVKVGGVRKEYVVGLLFKKGWGLSLWLPGIGPCCLYPKKK